uniref:Peptidase_S9_N domain-containing protein n=1 Tax=Gongylonema pulchrum TaxID=637853 RepID=A0A183D4X0_9BILA
LLVTVNRGCDPYNMLYYYDVQEAKQKITGKVPLKPVFDKLDGRYAFVDNDGDTALILTDHEAPMYKLIRVKMSTANVGPSAWETVIPEDEKNTLELVMNVGGDRLLVSYIEDVKNTLYVYCPKTGRRLYQIPFEIGTFVGIFGQKSLTEVFLHFDSFLTPGIIYYTDFKGKKPTDQIEFEVGFHCA